jgi:hypothetical protein
MPFVSGNQGRSTNGEEFILRCSTLLNGPNGRSLSNSIFLPESPNRSATMFPDLLLFRSARSTGLAVGYKALCGGFFS